MFYTFDACALLAFLNDEEGADIFDVVAENESIPIFWFR